MDIDRDQLERIRQKAYAIVQADPGGPNADQARRILSKLPKIKVGQGFEQPGLPKQTVHGELAGGDFGGEQTLPQTPDEAAGIENKLAGLTLPQKAALVAGSAPNRRQFERGMDDMLTFGAGQKIAGKIGRALGDQPDVDLGATGAEDARTSPNARGYGQLAGALSGKGAAGLVGRGVLGATAPIANAGKGLLGSTILGAVRGGVANELTMPLIAGGQAAVQGENPIPIMKEEAKNPFNSAAGALLGIPSGLSRGIRQTGQTGRDIRLAEEYRATPTPFGGAKGGAYESSPLLREAEGTAGEQGQASRRAAEHVMNTLDKERSGLQAQYGADKASARDQGFLEGRISTDAVRQEAQKLLSGMGLTSSERSAIQREVLDELDKHPGGMTVDDFNDFRGKLGRIFGVGPGETAVPAIDVLRRSAKGAIDETEMGPINERYSKGREALTRKHEQLGISEGGRREVQERRIANVIQRRANDEAPGAGINEAGDLGIAQFLAENPHLKAPFDTARLLAAKERMSAGIEPQGGFFRRVGKHGLLEKNLEPALVGMYRLGAPADRLAIPAALAARFYLQGGQP